MVVFIKLLSTVVLLLTMMSLNVLFKLDENSEFNKTIIRFCKDFLYVVFILCLLVILFVTNG
jgi:hypothetical protein